MPSYYYNLLSTLLGVLVTMVAVTFSLVASTDYRGVLRVALTSSLLALVCFAVPHIRGGWAWRLMSVVLALPACWVLIDFAERAPGVFAR